MPRNLAGVQQWQDHRHTHHWLTFLLPVTLVLLICDLDQRLWFTRAPGKLLGPASYFLEQLKSFLTMPEDICWISAASQGGERSLGLKGELFSHRELEFSAFFLSF